MERWRKDTAGERIQQEKGYSRRKNRAGEN
jgi:hypothetical protein